jgi:hypothetical protein
VFDTGTRRRAEASRIVGHGLRVRRSSSKPWGEEGSSAALGQLEEDNKGLARRMLAALSEANVDFIKEHYAEDFRIWVAGSLPFSGAGDKASAVVGMPAVLSLFPTGLRFSIVAMTAKGDRVGSVAQKLKRRPNTISCASNSASSLRELLRVHCPWFGLAGSGHISGSGGGGAGSTSVELMSPVVVAIYR